MTNFEKVWEFHEEFGCQVQDLAAGIDNWEKLLRIRLMHEELGELIAAMQLDDLPLVADSLADLLYVVYGTAVAYGMPMDEIFEEVHRSNMTKTARCDEGGKILKGDLFEPPDIEGVLEKQANDIFEEEE